MLSASLPCVAVQCATVSNINAKKERLPLVSPRFLETVRKAIINWVKRKE